MYKILNAYSGWSTVNYVLNDVKNPIRTLKVAGTLGLGITSLLYILANLAYCALVPYLPILSNSWTRINRLTNLPSVSTKEEIQSSGVTVAGLFFKNVFGEEADRALSVFVALRLVSSYSGDV